MNSVSDSRSKNPTPLFQFDSKRLPALTAFRFFNLLTVSGLLILIVFGQRAFAQNLKFTTPVTYPAGHPFVVTSGDFNSDGRIDLIAGDVTTSDLVMLLGNGDGTLQPPVTYHLAAAPYELVTADFNRDGKLDIATADSSPRTSINIFLGKGDGSFEQPVTYPVAGRHLVVADFNGDGWPDIAAIIGILPNANAIVLLNNGDGTLQNPQNAFFPLAPLVLAAKDVNGDGKVDLLTVSKTGAFNEIRMVSVLAGNGDGTFRSPTNSSANLQGSGPLSINVGDFDRDGNVDVVFTDEYLSVFKGLGDGTFKGPTVQPRLNNTSVDLKVGDFNGDGKLDLVSAGVFRGEALQVLLGNGDGTFANTGPLINGMSSVSVLVADLNGDTRPDLAGEVDNQLTVALVNLTPGNIDNSDYFVHQHYMDFLDREPDAPGFNYWSNQIASCGADAKCVDSKRANVSAAFYLSIEYQQSAYFIERLYKTAFGDATATSTVGAPHQLSVPVMHLNELQMDAEQISSDVVVGQSGWTTVLENNKQSFLSQFVARSRFTSSLPTTLTPQEFVDRLNQNAGNVLSAGERTSDIGLFGGNSDTSNTAARAQALRQVAENQDLYNSEFNRAFVLMQYFGYLRRNPNDGPDNDYTGYEFWLNKLNSFNGDFDKAEMVKAFINSDEYRKRFGP